MSLDSDQTSPAADQEAFKPVTVVFVLVLLVAAAFGIIEFGKDHPLEDAAGAQMMDKFASWQDWGGQNKIAKTLHEALEMEHRAWEMTRQETCSSEAGDPPPQFKAWKATSSRCQQLRNELSSRESTRKLDCWEVLVSTCAALGEKNCGSTWKEALSGASHRLRMPLDEPKYPLDDISLCGGKSGISRSWTFEERRKAKSWFERNVQVYVLEMPGLVLSDKHETIFDLTQHGLEAAHVAGFDLLSSSDLEAAHFSGSVPTAFNETLLRDQAYAISKAASHFHIQNLASTSPAPKPIALVLEDGVGLATDFREKVWALIQEEIPCDWDVLSLSSSCPAGRCISPHLARIGPHPDENQQCDKTVSGGFGGILYRSAAVADFRKRWMEVAFDANHPNCLNLDASLKALSDEVAFYAVPAVQTPRILSC